MSENTLHSFTSFCREGLRHLFALIWHNAVVLTGRGVYSVSVDRGFYEVAIGVKRK